MFKKYYVDLIYRLICLMTFTVVVLFSESIITLAFLTVYFFISTKKENDFFFIFLYLISLLFFCVAFYGGNYILFRIVIIIEFAYYFLNMPRFNKIITKKVDNYLDKRIEKEKKEKGDIIDKEEILEESEMDYIRFKSSRNTKKIIKKNDLIPTLYLTLHMFLLFLSIAIG